MTDMSDDTLRILSNKEVIDINQDPLGIAGHRVAQKSDTEVWAGPLSDGGVAVVLFNAGPSPATITADWSDIFLHPNQEVSVRDLWKLEDLGKAVNSITATVPSHGVVMYRLTPIDKQQT